MGTRDLRTMPKGPQREHRKDPPEGKAQREEKKSHQPASQPALCSINETMHVVTILYSALQGLTEKKIH